ncbi:flagellar assembly protein FliW [Bacillus methanolicus]|uniref:flagellar assembly protein FliW n=1 Tax=Bacillus methanolicus TaxID=1471 RepID=UPI0023807F2F|nr:flagellar assembly protein FliW [Bacillus methanolicus]MDE3840145.1 flagellar assembly protein FliW [Bacillus methanolicus]
MKIETKYHGEVEISEQDIWTFEKGIPGFPDEKKFVVLPLPENDIYAILQSVQSPYLGFVIVNPFVFFKDYSFEIDDTTIEQLKIEKETDVLVYSILTVQDPFEKTTANLQAPLIMNIKNMQAKQIILNDGQYTTKHLILPAKAVKG